MSNKHRRVLSLLGTLLAVVGMVFVGWRLVQYSNELDLSRITPWQWVLVLLLSVLYGVGSLLLAVAWWQLLDFFGVRFCPLRTIRIYGVSQLAKYVPGNVFQFAGRQALGMSNGIPAGPLAKSMLLELILIALAGLLFGYLVLPAWLPILSGAESVGLLIVTAAAMAVSLYRQWAKSVAWAFLALVLFLWLSAAVFAILLDMVHDPPSQWLLMMGAFVLAWLAGFVTPGAPAGVGVREMVLLVLLEGQVAPGLLLLAVLLGRLVTVLGDVWFFLGALALPSHRKVVGHGV
ncbi:MAG TPA: hypothetical protein VIC30_04110 [Orrella sp.]